MTKNKSGFLGRLAQSKNKTKRIRKRTPKKTVKKATKSSKKRTAKTAKNQSSIFSKVFGLLKSPFVYITLIILILVGAIYVAYLDSEVRGRFEGRIWAVPSKVFARSLELTPNMKLDPDGFEQELRLMAYEKVTDFPQQAGQYRRWKNYFELISRDFKDSDSITRSVGVRLNFKDQQLLELEQLYTAESLSSVRLDPALIGSIYPGQTEDRQLLRLSDVPERLIETLIAVEDRSFYDHVGVNPFAIARALLTNIRAGKKVQGGSTLTQQLVKNLFLSSQRSYWRKINEAIMALLLEWHYDKKSILEAYINEVYLGQNKSASIHGFELGSQFYFNKSLKKLSTDQIALLIGVIKGPSYYNPRKNKTRATERRDLVLDVMLDQGVISQLHYNKYKKRPLAISSRVVNSGVKFPAFTDLIKRQLHSRFSTDMLKHEGLQIYSTLDPQVQLAAEQSVTTTLKRLQTRNKTVPLQTAVVVTDVATSEVLAVVGDKDTGFHGFNRVLDASRQVGSLIKPAIYLAALNSQNDFHLSSPLSDTPLTLKSRNGDVWQPKNYDRQYRGDVIFHDALVSSYNVPSVRLGLKIGLEEIVSTLRNLGLEKDVPIYPSMLLGAFELTPYEVAGMYQTIADNGRQLGLHAIRSVLSHEGKPLVHFAEEKKYTIKEDNIYLIKTALHDVTQTGTAKSLANLNIKVAGKTGTTDKLRDSWFAGFSEDKLAVVWVGNDDNLQTGLTGSSGALKVWAELFQHIPVLDLELEGTENIEYHRVDRKTGLLAGFGCDNTVKLPFLKNHRPVEYAECD